MFTCCNGNPQNICENHDLNGSSENDEFDRLISADKVLKAVKLYLNECFVETH